MLAAQLPMRAALVQPKPLHVVHACPPAVATAHLPMATLTVCLLCGPPGTCTKWAMTTGALPCMGVPLNSSLSHWPCVHAHTQRRWEDGRQG